MKMRVGYAGQAGKWDFSWEPRNGNEKNKDSIPAEADQEKERERDTKKRKRGRRVHFNATMPLMGRCKMYTRERERERKGEKYKTRGLTIRTVER